MALNHQRKHSLKIQAWAGSLVVAAFLLTQERDLILSALYGYAVGLAVLIMLVAAIKIADKKAKEDPKGAMVILYLAAVIRFVILAVLLILGMSDSVLGLDPLGVILPFIVMQISQVLGLLGKKRLTD
jgi:ATP synthase protein I